MKYSFLFLLFILILSSPFIFSSSFNCSTVDDVGNFVKYDDKVCVCILKEDTGVSKYCAYFKENFLNSLNKKGTFKDTALEDVNAPLEDVNAPLEDVNAPLEDVNAPLEDVNAPLIDVNAPLEDVNFPLEDVNKDEKNNLKDNCNQEEITNINREINSLKESLREINILNKKLDLKKSKLEILLKRYTICLNKDYKTNSSIISGRFSINNVGEDVSVNTIIVEDDFENDTLQDGNRFSEVIEVKDIVDENQIENINNLINVSLEIEENNLNNSDTVCSSIKNDISILREEIKKDIVFYKNIEEENKKTILKLKKLIIKKESLLKKCRPISSYTDCENEISNLENKKQKLYLLINNLEKTNTSKQEYLGYREDYFLINNKIKYLKENCYKEKEIITMNDCSEKKELISQIERLKKEYVISNNVENTYSHKRKIDYLTKQLDAIVCEKDIERDLSVVKKLKECMDNLKYTDLTEDKIKEICSNRYNLQYQNKINSIDRINDKIAIKEEKLKELNNRVKDIKEKLSVEKNNLEKENYITENANYILQDTILKLENRILDLKKNLEQIEISNKSDNLKEKQIEVLNSKIASLEIVKDSVLDVEDVAELKKVLRNARNQDIISRKSKNVNFIFSEIEYIEKNILDKYFKDHSQYLKLSEILDQLKQDANSINLESTNLDDYYLAKEKLESFKKELRNY